MVSTLQDLIAPMREAEFLRLVRERRVAYFSGAPDNRFRNLLDWPAIVAALEDATNPVQHLRVTKNNGVHVPQVFYMDGGKPSVARLTQLLQQGASVLFKALDPNVPQLKKLSDNIRKIAHEQISIAVVVTTGTGGALKVHYDVPDVLVLQIEGSKRWRIYDAPVLHPVKGMPVPDPPQTGLAFDSVLEAGDTLLLPAGYWHYCENGPGRSIHAAILFHPLTGKYAMEYILRRVTEDEDFRRPLVRHVDREQLNAAEAALKARLTDEINRLSLEELWARHQNESAPSDDY